MRRAILFSALALMSCQLDLIGLEADGGTPDIVGDAPDGAPLVDGSLADSAHLVDGSPLVDGAPLDSALGDASIGDGSIGDAAVCTPNGSPSCFTLPMGWTLIGFLDSQASGCAAGFATVDLEEGAMAGSNVCACGVGTVTTAPSCTGGRVGLAVDTTGAVTCGIAGDPTKLANNPAGQCATDLTAGVGPMGLDVAITAPPPTGGNCTAPAVPHKENVNFAEKSRACIPPNPASVGCVGNVCAPNVPAPLHACLLATGNQTCPGAFTTRHVVGTDVTFDCAACDSTLSATCTGTMTFYGDTMCTTGAAPLVADGMCRSGAALAGNAYRSYKYAGGVPTTSCGPPGPPLPPANLALVGEKTICCAP